MIRAKDFAHFALCLSVVGVSSFLSACQTQAGIHVQSEESQLEEEVAELEWLIEKLYGTFSFDAGAQPDWVGMESLFAQGANLVAPIRDGGEAEVTGAAVFLASFKEWIESSPVGKTGLHERVLDTRIDVFQNIAHAYVTFEGFVPGEECAQTLGLDSLQLVRDQGEWKLVSFSTQYSGSNLPMPQRFLERGQRME
jgi:hypothetical protein